MGQQPTNKRAGTTLSPAKIDAAKAAGNHRRNEALKDTINAVKIVAICGTAAAIPVLYFLILYVSWDNTTSRDEWLQKGLVGVISFALGKVNFNFGEKNE